MLLAPLPHCAGWTRSLLAMCRRAAPCCAAGLSTHPSEAAGPAHLCPCQHERPVAEGVHRIEPHQLHARHVLPHQRQVQRAPAGRGRRGWELNGGKGREGREGKRREKEGRATKERRRDASRSNDKLCPRSQAQVPPRTAAGTSGPACSCLRRSLNNAHAPRLRSAAGPPALAPPLTYRHTHACTRTCRPPPCAHGTRAASPPPRPACCR